MRQDPVQLGREDPDVLGAARHLDVEELLEGEDARPLAEQRADVLERVEVGDRVVVVGVLAELLDAAMEVAEDRIEVDDLLALELQDDPEHAVGRRVLGSHVDEHLAVAERVELALALGPRRVRRDRLEDAGRLVELDARVVRRHLVVGVAVGRRRAVTRAPSGPTSAGRALRGVCDCSMWRTPAAGRARRVVGEVEVLAEREAW